jgi:hypothetical protein
MLRWIAMDAFHIVALEIVALLATGSSISPRRRTMRRNQQLRQLRGRRSRHGVQTKMIAGQNGSAWL